MRFPMLRTASRSFLFLALAAAGCADDGGEVVIQPVRQPAPKSATAAVPPATPTPTPTPIVITPALVPLPATFAERLAAGKRHLAKGATDEAVRHLEGAIALASEDANARVELARAYLKLNDPKRARVQAERAVELAPGSSGAWNVLGRAHLVAGDHEEAIAAFERALDENEENAWAWNNLGLAHAGQGQWEDAILAYERATQSDAREPYMWNNLGVAYEHVARSVEATVAYKQGKREGSEAAKLNLARLESSDHAPTSASVEPGLEPGNDAAGPDDESALPQ